MSNSAFFLKEPLYIFVISSIYIFILLFHFKFNLDKVKLIALPPPLTRLSSLFFIFIIFTLKKKQQPYIKYL